MDNLKIRQETVKDQQTVIKLIERAFADEIYSDQKEHLLVERLHKSDTFVPELSLVATINNKIVGYILLTPITIGEETSLALAPVAVLPEHQNEGIGRKLVQEAHTKAESLGYGSIILLGLKDYYPRFGYKPLSDYGIQIPFDAPQEYVMGVELRKDALKNVSGKAIYPKEFFE